MNNKKVAINFGYLLGTNISLYVFPLIAVSFLLRTIGTEEYGLMQIILSFHAYLVSVILYGQILSGTNAIAQNSNNKLFIDRKFYIVILSRLFLFVGVSIVVGLLMFIPAFYENWILYFIGILLLFGNVFQLDWFYNGLQEMKYNALFTIIPKALFLILIFLLIEKGDDCTLALFVHCLGYLISGLLSFAWAIYRYEIKFDQSFFDTQAIVLELKDSFKVFLSTFVVNFYSVNNVFILSLFVDKLMVGYYSIAVKIFMALKGLSVPICQAILPRLSELYTSSKSTFRKYVRYYSISVLTLFAVGSIFFYFLAPYFLEFYTGKDISTLKPVLTVINIFLLGLMAAPLGGLFSGVLVILNKKNELLKINSAAAILNILFVVPIVYLFGIYGMATLAVVLIWIVVLAGSACFHKNSIQ